MLWYALWIGAAAVCAVTPNLIGYEDVEAALPGFLFFALCYWQLSPLVTLTLGASLEMRKLAFFPVSTPTLFAVECLLRLWNGAEIILVLSGLFVGLITAGSPHGTALAVAYVLFVLFNVLCSAGVRNLVERIFRRRRLREIVLTLMVSVTLLPQALVFSETAREWARAAVRNQSSIPYWASPSGVAARIGGGAGGAFEYWLMAAMIAVAAVFGYLQFRASCGVDQGALAVDPAPRLRPSWALLTALPSRLLPDPLGALVEKEIKYLWRSPRFRLPYFMGFTFGVIAWAPILKRLEGNLGEWAQGGVVSLITLYALLLLGPVMFLNRFGFDRSSVRFYFWMPLRFEELLAAKNLATVLFAFSEMVLIAAVCRLIGFPVGLVELAEAAATTFAALLFLLAIGNHISIRYPTPSSPDRISRAGGGHGVRAATQFLLFPLSLAPVVAALGWGRVTGSPAAFAWAMSAAAAAGGLCYLFTFLRSAGRGQLERERLVGCLSEGSGPLTAE